jgi:hypothetical protein
MKRFELPAALYAAFCAGRELELRDRWMHEARVDRRMFGNTAENARRTITVSVRTARKHNWQYLRALRVVADSLR